MLYWGEERCLGVNGEFIFLFFFLSFCFSSLLRKAIQWRLSPLRWLYSTERRQLYRSLLDGTATALLSVGLGEERKLRPFYRCLSLTKLNDDISLYRWFSETKNTGDCCGWGKSKGKLVCMSLYSSSWILIIPLICFDLLCL